MLSKQDNWHFSNVKAKNDVKNLNAVLKKLLQHKNAFKKYKQWLFVFVKVQNAKWAKKWKGPSHYCPEKSLWKNRSIREAWLTQDHEPRPTTSSLRTIFGVKKNKTPERDGIKTQKKTKKLTSEMLAERCSLTKQGHPYRKAKSEGAGVEQRAEHGVSTK